MADTYELSNGHLNLVASSHGAELHSLRLDGQEYLWQGDPEYWKRHAPVLFPFVGRFTDDHYKLHGKTYPMTCHGFCQDAVFHVAEQDETHIVFELGDDDNTYAVYPFHFSFRVAYALIGNTVYVTYEVQNNSEEMMYFGLGAHPGFRVPLDEGLSFEDYTLEFQEACEPDRILFSDKVLVTGNREHYPLVDGKKIPLHHDLFDNDAIVLEHMSDTVALRSEKGKRSVTVSYPQMPYVGFWHAVKKDAPYVCIEPWVTLPSRDGIVEEFSCRSDLIRLPEDEVYRNDWTITLQ